MFPALMGPTRRATCTACQFNFPVAAETYRPELPTRCERCGGLCDVAAAVQPGQTADLEPLNLENLDTLGGQHPADGIRRYIRRWDLIAFKEPSSGNTLVKRVWGLPGEAIELRGGEAWVEGELLRKSLSELRQLSVPVYDLQHGGSGQWWISNVAEVAKTFDVSTANKTSQPSSLALQPSQFLHYQFCRSAPVHPSEVPAQQWLVASPMVDSYSINQGLSTALHSVDDCLLSLSLDQPLIGSLGIEMRLQAHVIRVVLESTDEPTQPLDTNSVNHVDPASDSGQAVATWRIAGRQSIDVGWCEGRLLLESDGQSLVVEAGELELAFSAASHSVTNSASADLPWGPHELFRLGATVPVVITQLQLSRDLYLAPALDASPNRDSDRESPESLSGFYVLGDNLPGSRDSRQQLGRVSPSQVLGRISIAP